MSLPVEGKTHKNQLHTIVKELNSLTNILESVHQNKARFNAPTQYSSNRYPTYSQNYQAPFPGSFNNNTRLKHHNRFPTFPNKSLSLNNKFKGVANNTQRLLFNSQSQVKCNKFTFVAKKTIPLASKNSLQMQKLPKPCVVLKSEPSPELNIKNIEYPILVPRKVIIKSQEKTHPINNNVVMQDTNIVCSVINTQTMASKNCITSNIVPDFKSVCAFSIVSTKDSHNSIVSASSESNKFTFVAKKTIPLTSNNCLPIRNLPKPRIVLKCEPVPELRSRIVESRNVILKNPGKPHPVSSNVGMQHTNIMHNVNTLPIASNNCVTSNIVSMHPSRNVIISASSDIPEKVRPLDTKPPSRIVVDHLNITNKSLCIDISKKFDGSEGKINFKNSLKSIENNLSINNGKHIKDIAQRAISKISPKAINSKRKLLSTYKVVNKNSPFIKGLKSSFVKKESLKNRNHVWLKSNKDIAANKAWSTNVYKKFGKYKTTLVTKKKLPVKQKQLMNSKFKFVNKNGNNFVKMPMAVSEVKTMAVGKYKIVHKSKSPLRASTAKFMPAVKEGKKFDPKYRFINANKPDLVISCSSMQKPTKDTSADIQEIESAKPVNHVLKQKISQMKYIKTDEYEGYDLSEFTPEELVDMDTSSLFQLDALLKTSNNKRKSLIKMSKYKLVSKESRKKLKAAKMVKAKYQNKNRRSWKRLQSSSAYKETGYYGNSRCHQFKTRYQKRSPSKLLKFRQSSLLKHSRYKKTNFATIGDIRYRVSRTKMTKMSKKSLSPKHSLKKKVPRIIIVRGERFRMDPSGKSLKKISSVNNSNRTPLKRIDLGGRTYIGTDPDTLVQTTSPQIRNLASRVLHRSIQTVWASAIKKREMKKSNVYCMFFNRFGKCNRGTNCPYTHDPSKIAVCTRFLRGTCKEKNCPFSHVKTPGKMAICTYFLQGLCTNKECPYRHELLRPDAKLCKAFVRGYCSLGMKCQKAHILFCPQYFQGQCDKGTTCTYPHPPQREKKEENMEVVSQTLSSEKNCEDDPLSDDDSSGDEAFRYFDPKSFLSEDTLCEKEALKNIKEQIKKRKVIHCQPKRGKLMDCPVFIPLSFNDDSS